MGKEEERRQRRRRRRERCPGVKVGPNSRLKEEKGKTAGKHVRIRRRKKKKHTHCFFVVCYNT